MLQTQSTAKASPATDEIKAQCRKIIDGFRHREAIREDDIREWISHVVAEAGEAATWHATRAGGFGGSDIGILVRNFQGARADHQASAHDIVASKLLRAVPNEETGDMRRGHANEPRHAEMYYAKYGAVRDVEAYTKLSKATGLRVWMRYSPDDVVLQPAEVPNPALGGRLLRRLLIDYKAPRRVEPDAEIAFQYSCQLHQGAIISAHAGIHLDGLQLSQFDWAGWELKDDYVQYDQELARLILTAGDHYYDYVMRGELPPYVMTPVFSEVDEFVRRYGQKAQMLAQISAMAKAFTDEAERRADELKAELKGTRLAGTKLPMGDLTVTAVRLLDHEAIAKALTPDELHTVRKVGDRPAYDTAAMVAKLKSLNVDVKQFRTERADPDKAYELLLAKGFDPESMMEEQLRLGVSNFLKQQAQDVVAATYPPALDCEAPTADAANQADQGPVIAAAGDDEADPNVRDGESTERLAPRTVSA